MTYSTDISGLGAVHHWKLDGNSTDAISTADGVDTSMLYTGASLTEDATNCATTNATGDRISIPSTTDINNSAQTRKAIAGWFEVTAIQTPIKRIYGEGNNATCFQFMFCYGNNCMFEVVEPTNFTLQVFGPVLQPNRIYHLCGIFEGNGFANEIRFYVDGVKQLNASPANRQPGTPDLDARGVAEFGDPAGTVGVGGDIVLLNAPVNGNYQHWVAWDGVNAILTDTEVRETLFERGALPDVTIASDTQTAMQTALDVYSGTTRGDAPLCIRVGAVTGGGNFTLNLDNITFDPLASIHVQYTGVDVLTLVNINGSNASITSVTGGGSISLKTQTTLSITVMDINSRAVVPNARVYIEAANGGDLIIGTVIMNTTTNVSGIATLSFLYTSDQPIVGRVRQGSASPYYQNQPLAGTITLNGLTQTILQIPDGQ